MKRKNEGFAQAIVGVFMITVLLLLGYFTIVISGVDVLSGHHRVPVKIAFAHVGGLKERDNVMYRGTKVGAVDRVDVTVSNLVVTAMIDENVVLRTGYRASVANLSMLGGYFLKLEEGEGDILPLTTTAFVGTPPTDWMQDVAQIARNLNDLTSRREINEIVTNVTDMTARARAIAAKVDTIIARVERGEGTAGKLLSSDESVYREFRETTVSVKKAFDNVTTITDDLKDKKVLEDLKAGIAAFRRAAEGLDTKGLSEKGAALVEKGSALAEKATALAENLNAVAERLREGEGTLGRLTKDSKMYDEVNALIKDCRQVLDNYRDTTPISTFSSLAAGAL